MAARARLLALATIFCLNLPPLTEASGSSRMLEKLSDLLDESFSVSSHLHVVYPGIKTTRYDIEELRSEDQRRYKMTYQTKDKLEDWQTSGGFEQGGAFIADTERQVYLRTENTCKRVPYKLVGKMFHLGALDGFMDVPEIIGPTRILALLVSPGPSASSTSTQPMRTIESPISINFKYLDNTITAHYSANKSQNLAMGVPLEVVVAKTDQTAILIYDFARVTNLADREPTLRSLSFDTFAVERAASCGAAKQQYVPVGHRLNGLMRQPYRFSFKAQPDLDQVQPGTQMLVGYEPTIATLRVERRVEAQVEQDGSVRRTSSITNFVTGLTYHVIRRRGQMRSILDKVLPVVTATGTADPGDKNAFATSCVATRATPTVQPNEKSENPYPLGEMLFGFKRDRMEDVQYLGLARVRGILANVYELYDSSWPVWFQQPAVYFESKNLIGVSEEAKVRAPTGRPSDNRTIWNTVIYLSKSEADNSGEITRSDLLRLEMFEIDKQTGEAQQRAAFTVHDFAWHLTSSGDLYSLEDMCVSRRDNQYGRLDLLFELDSVNASELSEMTFWLKSSPRRNFALIQALQEQLGLPSTEIYDFESRIEVGPNKQRIIPVTMRLAERTQAINQLIYLGRGALKQSSTRKFISFNVFSFQTCYLTVAHRRVDTIFAFRPSDSRCLIYREPVVGTVKMTLNSVFDMMDEQQTPSDQLVSSLEIYRIRGDGGPFLAANQTYKPTTFENIESALGSVSHLNLVNDLHVNYEQGSMLVSKVRLAAFQLSGLDDKTSPILPATSDGADSDLLSGTGAKFDSNKFKGVGLVASDESSTLIEPERMNLDRIADKDGHSTDEKLAKAIMEHSGVTFGQCQAQCLVSAQCASFSWCLHEGQPECILSRVDFHQNELAAQLVTLQAKRGRFGEIVTLEAKGRGEEDIGPVRVRVKKHPNCELHNKQFSQLFLGRPEKVKFDLTEMRLHAVNHREVCARLCFNKSLQVLRQDVDPMRGTSLGALRLLDENTSEGALEKLFKAHKEAHGKLCTSYAFFDRANFLALGDSRMNRVARRIEPKSAMSVNDLKEPTVGYCILGDALTASQVAQIQKELAGKDEAEADEESTSGNRILVSLEQFSFDFRFMFEKQYGVALRKSEQSAEVQAALSAVVHNMRGGSSSALISRDEFALLRNSIERGDNSVHWMTLNAAGGLAGCARLCFLQLVPLWPGCKSFEYLEQGAAATGKKTHMCLFNSVSLRETLLRDRRDLVRDYESEVREAQQNSTTTSMSQQGEGPTFNELRVWHFEPKPSFVGQSLDWARNLEFNEAAKAISGRSSNALGATIELGSLGMSFCVLLMLTVGIGLGMHLGTRLISEARNREDRQDLVDSIHEAELAMDQDGSPQGDRQGESTSIEFSDLMTIGRASQ